MAELLWGQVYFHDTYAGLLRQEPGERCSFTYDSTYVGRNHSPIAWTLPLQKAAFISQHGLHPFFDNLVAEGWLEEAQSRLLGKRSASRFELLLAFGQDCAGAVSIQDPAPADLTPARIDRNDPRQLALLHGRASLSGIQPKLALVRTGKEFRPATSREVSTHIAKFASRRHDDLLFNELLTMRAFNALLPDDPLVDLQIGSIEGFSDPALIITRFDRTPHGKRIHFEEFNQLLDRPSTAKYDGAYREMADFIRTTPGCLPAETYRLYLRILAGLLLGNTDMHLKNFAMFHTPEGLRLTPSYDQVAAALYDYNTIALSLGGASDIPWTQLKARSLIRLGEEFGLSRDAMAMACDHLARRKDGALHAINDERTADPSLKAALTELVKKRWNGTFNLIGSALSKKR
ncbi:MAG TPA: HipA domain-containing protein [Phycisphaerae bacterium]|nr:HipA domain-containing protein [Phycisphaerae bacterium]